MDPQTSQVKFKEADQLFNAARYQEALVLLEDLNRQFPNTKNIVYPAAMCLDKLGRSQEALPLCNHLIQQFQDPRAVALKADIEGRATGSNLDNMYDMAPLDLDGPIGGNDILDIPSTTVPHKVVEPEGIPWMKYGLIALGVMLVALVVIVPLATYEPPPPGSEPVLTEGEGPSVGLIYLGMFACFCTIVAFQVAGAYLALMLMRSLPHEDISGNVFNLFISFFLATILESSFLGILLTLVWFHKVYDLGFGGLVFLYVCRIIFGAVGFFIGMLLFAGSIAAAMPNAGVAY